MIEWLGVGLGAISLSWQVYSWRVQRPRYVVKVRHAAVWMGPASGGNHWGLQIDVTNRGRAAGTIYGWSIVSRGHKTPSGERWGVRAGWNGNPVSSSDDLPLEIKPFCSGRWFVSLSDSTTTFPTLDQLVPDHEIRVELETRDKRIRAHSEWMKIPSRDRRRTSHEIARDECMAVPTEPAGIGGAIELAHLLVESPSVGDQ